MFNPFQGEEWLRAIRLLLPCFILSIKSRAPAGKAPYIRAGTKRKHPQASIAATAPNNPQHSSVPLRTQAQNKTDLLQTASFCVTVARQHLSPRLHHVPPASPHHQAAMLQPLAGQAQKLWLRATASSFTEENNKQINKNGGKTQGAWQGRDAVLGGALGMRAAVLLGLRLRFPEAGGPWLLKLGEGMWSSLCCTTAAAGCE